MKQAITMTIVFEAPALNRDEGVGNTTSLKKLSRGWGEVYTFISRPALRHYLWETLNRYDPQRWKATPVKKDGEVIQFDLNKGDIDKYAELDMFGYMYTEKGNKEGEGIGKTRKGVMGIARAMSLEPWKNDVAIYANHDLVRRYVRAYPDEKVGPNPYNCQEHFSFYKAAFTIDCMKVGVNEEGKLVITEDERKARIRSVLHALYDGLCYHVAGESPGIYPLFIVAGIVKIPMPVFYSSVNVKYVRKNGMVCPQIDEEFLETALRNGWIEKKYIEGKGEKSLIFIESRRPDFVSKDFIKDHSITTNWEEFINKYLFEETEEKSLQGAAENKEAKSEELNEKSSENKKLKEDKRD